MLVPPLSPSKRLPKNQTPCTFFLNGNCANGDQCEFLHDSNPDTNKTIRLFKTEMCRLYMDTGSCKFGSRCQFAHSIEELRPISKPKKFKTQVCKRYVTTGVCPFGDRCNYVHSDYFVGGSVSTSPYESPRSGPSFGTLNKDLDSLESSPISSPKTARSNFEREYDLSSALDKLKFSPRLAPPKHEGTSLKKQLLNNDDRNQLNPGKKENPVSLSLFEKVAKSLHFPRLRSEKISRSQVLDPDDGASKMDLSLSRSVEKSGLWSSPFDENLNITPIPSPRLHKSKGLVS